MRRAHSSCYLSNIVGSALGSYLTRFVFMDFLPLRYVTVVLTLLGLVLGTVLMLCAKLERRIFIVAALGVFAAALFVVQAPQPLFRGMYERMLSKTGYVPGAELKMS